MSANIFCRVYQSLERSDRWPFSALQRLSFVGRIDLSSGELTLRAKQPQFHCALNQDGVEKREKPLVMLGMTLSPAQNEIYFTSTTNIDLVIKLKTVYVRTCKVRTKTTRHFLELGRKLVSSVNVNCAANLTH